MCEWSNLLPVMIDRMNTVHTLNPHICVPFLTGLHLASLFGSCTLLSALSVTSTAPSSATRSARRVCGPSSPGMRQQTTQLWQRRAGKGMLPCGRLNVIAPDYQQRLREPNWLSLASYHLLLTMSFILLFQAHF